MGAENAQAGSTDLGALTSESDRPFGGWVWALKTFQGRREAVTPEPGFGGANVGEPWNRARNIAELLAFYRSSELARRLLSGG